MAEKATSSLTLASLLEHGAARDGVAHGVIGCESEVCARSMECVRCCWQENLENKTNSNLAIRTRYCTSIPVLVWYVLYRTTGMYGVAIFGYNVLIYLCFRFLNFDLQYNFEILQGLVGKRAWRDCFTALPVKAMLTQRLTSLDLYS